MRLSVLVVDDQADFRAVARQVLERGGFQVVGEAGDARAALEAVDLLRPDVVLLDVRLPDLTGVEVAKRISSFPAAPMVVLISTADYSHAVAGCGATGFVPKADLSGDRLSAALGRTS